MTQQFASRGRRSSAVELALRLVRDGASPADAAKVAGCHVRSVRRALTNKTPYAGPVPGGIYQPKGEA